MQQLNISAHLKTILQFGILAALASVGLHLTFYALDWMYSIWGGLAYFGLSLVLCGIFYTLAVYRARKKDAEGLSFWQILNLCLLLSVATGIVSSVYDIFFYAYVEPEFDIKILLKQKEQLEAFYRSANITENKIQESLQAIDERIDLLRKTPQTPLSILFGKISTFLLFGIVFGFILGLVFKKRTLNTSTPATHENSSNNPQS